MYSSVFQLIGSLPHRERRCSNGALGNSTLLEGRRLELFPIDGGYNVVVLTVMGAVLGVLQ